VRVMAKVEFSVEDITCQFSELEDPRSTINRLHPLPSVLVISIMAILAGATGPTSIAEWANIKAEFLLKLLDLPNGIPQKDVYRRVLCLLKPEVFQSCFMAWLTLLRAKVAAATGITQPVLAVDGKTLRRSFDKQNDLGALHSVTVWASEFGLSLGQVACAEKSNEITAIPELLRLVDISGAIITIDAMGTQKAIAAEIVNQGADYVLALKGNQGSLTMTTPTSMPVVIRLKRMLTAARNSVIMSTCRYLVTLQDATSGRDLRRLEKLSPFVNATERRRSKFDTSFVV
jgi:hypothetical protein